MALCDGLLFQFLAVSGYLLLVSSSPFLSESSNSLDIVSSTDCDNQFHCEQSSQCVFYPWRCDNVTDCIYGEDEADCHNNTCPTGYHRCDRTGQCIPLSWICEGSFKCPQEDSLNDHLPCSKYHCLQGKFRCANGRCISTYLLCDGDHDCSQGEDEAEEVCQNFCTQSRGKYLCKNGLKCLRIMSKCDLIEDCPDGDDELNCVDESS